MIKDADKIIFHRRLILYVETKLLIHNIILFQIFPFVKYLSSNLNGINFIIFDITKGIIIKVFDKFWVMVLTKRFVSES